MDKLYRTNKQKQQNIGNLIETHIEGVELQLVHLYQFKNQITWTLEYS